MQEGNNIPLDDLIGSYLDWRDGHSKATSIIRSVLANLSLISSSILIWMIRRSHAGLSTIYHRILLGMCVADLMVSVSFAHFNLIVPSDDDYRVWNARGNQATCSAQGFLLFVGSISGLFYK